MQDCKPISTTLPINFKLSSSMCSSNKAERNKMSRVPNASAMRSLMFYDLFKTRHFTSSGSIHDESWWRALKNYKEDSKIHQRNVICCLMLWRIRIYCQGLCKFRFCRRPWYKEIYNWLSWVSKLQSIVALFTTKAEYMTTTQTCKEAIWMQRLLEKLEDKQEKFHVFCNSQSALHIARNSTFHSRINHIGV